MPDEHPADERGRSGAPGAGLAGGSPGRGETGLQPAWARLRGVLWQPPRRHGEQPRERSVGPIELFYDLAVVVLVAQAAHHLARNLAWRGIADFTIVFTLVWIGWINGTLHHELHGREDARARTTFLVQVLVFVVIGAFIPDADGRHGAAFAVAEGVLFAILAVLWWLAGRADSPEYRGMTQLFVTGTALCAALLFASAALPTTWRVLAWGGLEVAYLLGFATVGVRVGPADVASLLVTDALMERFAAFIIIVLGETLTGVVSGLSEQPVRTDGLSVGVVAVVVGFGAWWTYFDVAGGRHPRAERTASLTWVLGHLPLTAAIGAMGAAMVSLVHHAQGGHTPPSTAWVLSASAALVLCSTILLVTSLVAWGEDRSLYRPLAGISAGAAAGCLAVGGAQPDPLILGLLLVGLFSIPWGFVVRHRITHASRPAGSR